MVAMNGLLRIGAFAAVLALAFAAAAAAGGALDPDVGDGEMSTTTDAHGGDSAAAAADPVRGLATAADGLRVVVDEPELRRGRSERVAFRIVDAEGRTVRDFDLAHEKRMHLIVVRRDLTGFQHLHPAQRPDGTWTAPVRLDDAGSYRLFADFTRDGEAHTLASDLRVDGSADLRPLPVPRTTARSDGGYDVELDATGSELRFTVTRDGETVRTEPYLGAGGHLVVLREGDLAFLHVHPEEHRGDGAVAFETQFPTSGRYRLFLQFKHEGRVHTVAFTKEVR
jgi:hypothetical protein